MSTTTEKSNGVASAADNNKMALIQPEELSLVETNRLNAKQLKLILQRTPSQYVRKRPAKGGGEWQYVTGGYIKKCLNLMFGWDWDFEILYQEIIHGEAIVKGRLTCRIGDRKIVKEQFGNKEIMYRKAKADNGESVPLSIGNDLKAAATDALKKCATEIGLASDIYNAEEFRELNVDTTEIDPIELRELYEMKKDTLTAEERTNAERILNGNEVKSYSKLQKSLQGK